jgi:hypothetical protein
MRILRGLSSRVLPCGCLAGVYETYDARVVHILDAKGESCADGAHEAGKAISLEREHRSSSSSLNAAQSGPSDRPA